MSARGSRPLSLRLIAIASMSLLACDPDEPPPEPDGPQPLPPPIVGGGLVVTRDDSFAIASDLDRDVLWFFDVKRRTVTDSIVLEKGSQPNRLVEDDKGSVHVVLRGAGKVVKATIPSREPELSTHVCSNPRGIAFDDDFDGEAAIHVACADGDLVTLRASDHSELRRVFVHRDLREVVKLGDDLLVTTLREALLYRVDSSGVVGEPARPEGVSETGETFDAVVGRRLVVTPSGGVALLHQRAKADPVDLTIGTYTDGLCSGGAVVHSTIALFDSELQGSPGSYMPFAALPTDFAISPNEDMVVVVDPAQDQVLRFPFTDFLQTACWGGRYDEGQVIEEVGAQPVGVAFLHSGSNIVVFNREPSSFLVLPAVKSTSSTTNAGFKTGGASALNDGHELFHRPPAEGAIITCANCHVEGGDDGRVWVFAEMGERRTQNLRGDVIATAPFHWDGSLTDVNALFHDTLTSRMGGPQLDETQVARFSEWLSSIPSLAPPDLPADAVERGAAVFEKAGCSMTCHAGSSYTESTSEDVGTGGEFQVPGLRGVWDRAPYMHNGCAADLAARFDDASCGGDEHGDLTGITPSEVEDLIYFLESL